MHTFLLAVRNEKVRLYEHFAAFLLLLNGVAISLLLFTKEFQTTFRLSFCITVIVLIILSLYFLLSNRAHPSRVIILALAFLSAAASWILFSYWWAGVLLLLFFGLYRVSVRKFEILVQSSGIIYPSFPKQRIGWNEIDNIMLRDGLFTLDCSNNRIFQHLVDETLTPVNEQEFNEFCNRQLAEARQTGK
jgi:hypothetical protein